MQQPTSTSYQYGSTHPNTLSPTQSINPQQWNPTGVKQMLNGDEHPDNVSASDMKASSDPPNPLKSSGAQRPNSKFLSNFSHQLDNPLLYNVPLNGLGQNISVSSSDNYNPNIVEDTAGVQPPIGTPSTITSQYVPSPSNMQTQFTSTGPASTMTKSLPPGVITGITPQSYGSSNGNKTTQQPGSEQQPIPVMPSKSFSSQGSVHQSFPLRDDRMQSLSSVNGSFPLTLSTNGQPTVSHNYQPQGPTIFSNSTQPMMSSQQQPSTMEGSAQPASANSEKQAPPQSTSNYPPVAGGTLAPQSDSTSTPPTSESSSSVQPSSTSQNVMRPPNPVNSFQGPNSAPSLVGTSQINNFQPPTTASNFKPTSGNSFQPPASGNSFQPPASGNSFQPPTSASNFQPPTTASSFQAPASGNNAQPPVSTSSFQPPASANSFQAPASSKSAPTPAGASSFQAPAAASSFQTQTAASSFQTQTAASSFQPPASENSFQPPASTNNIQPPTSASNFQAPTSASNFQAQTSANSFQPPASASIFQTPASASSFQAPGPANKFQPPTSVNSFLPPTATNNYQNPSPASGFQATPSATNKFQAPTSANSFRGPPLPNSFQAPTSTRSFTAPTSANNFQGPSSASGAPDLSKYYYQGLLSGNFQAPTSPSNFQPPPSASSQAPPSGNSFQAPPTANRFQASGAGKAPLRPPASSYSFQSPASALSFQPSQPSNAPKLPPMPSAVPAFPQNPAYPQQTARPPPNPYTQPNKTVPLNGMPPLPGASQYQQPSIIPPQTNNQPSSFNNYQVPPRMQPPGNQPTGSYPAMPGYPTSQQASFQQTLDQFSNMSVTQGMNKMWGYEPHDLLNTRDILPSTKVEPPPIRLPQNLPESINCSRDLFRCTLTKIPESKSLLDKSRLPLGLLIHPFKDINNLKVIKNMIVRCRQCRTYINPFVQFLDSKQWKCNICFRTNEIHEQFLYDRNTEMFGDPYRRPEIQSATVEYLATSDYTVRDPPQPAMYLFLLDVSQIAAQSGYLYTVCEVLLNQLKSMPGDMRTSIAVITYDSAVHFYSLAEGQTQPSQLILTDIDDIFLPSPDNILVNLNECYDMIVDLLKQLPEKFKDNLDSGSALGPALQAAFKLLQPTGGRITIFQTCLPNRGPGALEPRENPNQRSNDQPPHMNPATDFYKKIALECTSFYIAVDLFILNSQYVDVATLSGVAKFSSGCIHHIPLYSGKNMSHVYQLDRMFSRYLTRKIGFESVMRIRCTKGLNIHTFHGNFFVRSTDLLALPNVNPDAGYGIQISIDEALTHIQYACFQVALLYTSSKGDRRIRVHTLCLPVVSNVNDVLVGADQQCIAGLLAKMAVDRSLQHSLSDAREAFLNVVCDVLSTYKITQTGHLTGSLLAPSSLKLLPLYVLALLKHPAFRIGQSTRLDDRVFAMTEMKCLPLNSLMLSIYPELYPIHTLDQDPTFEWNDVQVPTPRILQLSAERLQATGTYLLNLPDTIIILVRHGTSPAVCSALFGFQSVAQMPEILYELPQLETSLSLKLSALIGYLNDDKAYVSPVKVMKDSSTDRMEFYDKLIEDKNGGGMSYYEFLQRIREQVKSY